MSASDVSPSFHRLFHPPPDTCRWSVVWLFLFVVWLLFLFVVFVFACFLVLQVSGDFYHSSASSRSR